MCGMLIPYFISYVALIMIFFFGILVCYKYRSLERSEKERSLPLDAQLKVLKMAKEKMERAPHAYYLCGCISSALYDCDLDNICEDPIPVFCIENAILYGNARDSSLFWWPLTIAGKEDRLKFLDWCISQVELQIKYETQKNKRFYRKWFK